MITLFIRQYYTASLNINLTVIGLHLDDNCQIPDGYCNDKWLAFSWTEETLSRGWWKM